MLCLIGKMNMKNHKPIKTPFWLKALVFASVLIAIFALGLYIYSFGFKLANKQEVWGQFGDFIGGLLNPLFAFTALLALLYTINLQSRELKNSAIQLERSAEALDKQNKVMEKQNFEVTFFQLLRLYNDIVQDLHITTSDYENLLQLAPYKKSYDDRRCIQALSQDLFQSYLNPVARGDSLERLEESIDAVYNAFYDEYGSVIDSYFRIIYNIIKFVHSKRSVIEDPTFYTNLLRAQLSKYELTLILYNGISSFGNQKMLPLLKEYKILKHLDLECLENEMGFKVYEKL